MSSFPTLVSVVLKSYDFVLFPLSHCKIMCIVFFPFVITFNSLHSIRLAVNMVAFEINK